MKGFMFNAFKWTGFFLMAVAIFTFTRIYEINNQSKAEVNKQRHILEDMSANIVAYTQKHAGISKVQTPKGKIYSIDDYIKSLITKETHSVDFTITITLQEANSKKTYTATATYKNGSMTTMSGDATKVRLQKGDLITVAITPIYKQMVWTKFVEIEGRPLISTGKSHGYIKFREG